MARQQFKYLKSRHRELTSLQHRENSFESGPQLWFKIHLLSLHLFSGKGLESYGFWNLFFIGVGIVSCSWRVVSNRRSVNISDDYEKRMRWTSNIPACLLAHALSVWARFSLLGIFSASFPIMGIGIICLVHFSLVLIIGLISFIMIEGVIGPIYTLSEYCGSCCNKTADLFFHVCDVLLSILFSFLDFDEERYKQWPKIYYAVYCYVPAVENVILVVLTCFSGLTWLYTLIVGVGLLLSWVLLYQCEKVQLRIATIPSLSSLPIHPQSNPIQPDPIQCDKKGSSN